MIGFAIKDKEADCFPKSCFGGFYLFALFVNLKFSLFFPPKGHVFPKLQLTEVSNKVVSTNQGFYLCCFLTDRLIA